MYCVVAESEGTEIGQPVIKKLEGTRKSPVSFTNVKQRFQRKKKSQVNRQPANIQPKLKKQLEIENQPEVENHPEIENRLEVENEMEVENQPQIENQMEVENQPTVEGEGQVNVINRVAALPMVSSTLTQMTNAYNWTKDKNSLVKYTLETAESAVSMAASTAQPVVNKLEGPISAANDYANQQMDKLEEKVPVITDTPEKVMTDLQDGTKKMIENTKKAGSDKINNLLLTRLGKVLTTSVDTALLLSEFAVDYYLPPEANSANGGQIQQSTLVAAGVDEGEPIPEDKPLEATVQRASRVSNKVRHRVVNKAMRNVRYAQKRSQETLDKLHYTVDLIEYARTNIDSANKAVQSRIETTHQNLSKTWDDWTIEEAKEGDGEAKNEVEATNGEQRTLAIARNLAGRLRVLSGNIAGCVRLLPESLRVKVVEGRELADALYNSLEEAQTIRDLPTNVLVTAKQQLNKMSEISLSVADFLVSKTPLTWLVPDVDIDAIEFDYMGGSDEFDFDIRSDTSSDM